jgi:O-antigen ligase
MALMAVLSLFCYMTSLAIALTTYGSNLMNLRWLALFAVLIAGGFYWASSRWGKLYRWEKNDNMIVLVYLIVTFLSVITAENPLFSGLRWVSHALMIVTLLVLLKNSLTVGQAASILFFLKVVISALLLVSWLNPLSPVTLMDTFHAYRGAFGSSNALGQVAAVGAVLYLHGLLTDKAKWLRIGQVAMLCPALWTVWSSGSRSALVAFLTGVALMYYFYPKLIRGKLFCVALLVTSMILMFPWVPGKVKQIVLRSDKPWPGFSEQLSLAQKQNFAEYLFYARKQGFMEQFFFTRNDVWAAAWAGFQKRPLLGWGFGADDGISKAWEVQLKSIGTVTRDAVNDTLIVLESSGVVGLGAYALLVILALRQIPTRRERNLLHRIHSPPSSRRQFDFAAYHLHAITFVVAASLLLMVQFDNTALSAGNFISVTLWLCVALSGSVRVKATAEELLYQHHKHNLRWSDSQLVAMKKTSTEAGGGLGCD